MKIDEFWSRIHKQPDGCWRWDGARQAIGTGVVRVDGVNRQVVHYAMELLSGERPRARLRRMCPNHGCANPAHWIPMDDSDRFAAFVKPDGECRVWTGTTVGGYGQFRPRGKPSVLAHRHAYAMAYGAIPLGQHVLHRCDNPPCVRADHLFLGTDADNTADKIAKGRHLRGEDMPRAKLVDDDVRAIRRSRADALTLAKRFGVTRATIYYIRARKSWKHL